MGISQDTDRLARAMFRLEQIPDVLGVLGWYDSEPPDSVHRAALALSKGNLDALLDCRGCERLPWCAAVGERAGADARRAGHGPGTRPVPCAEAAQRRGRYLEDRFGAEGAGQIERRNGTLLGKGRDASAGTD